MAGGAPEVEARLRAAAEAVREREIVGQRGTELAFRLAQAEGDVTALRRHLAAEQRDVERLEGLSLSRVLAGLLGALDDRRARERAEADAVALRLDGAVARRDALHREHAAAAARHAELAGAPEAYARALEDKEQHLQAVGDPRAPQLLALADEQGRCRTERRELAEALQATATAYGSLMEVRQLLDRADGWSTWDALGGGMISSVMKHARMDEAADAAARADRCLLALRTELLDVGGAGPAAPQLALDELTRFVDVWLDNVFTDFSVARRIGRSQAGVSGCLRQVEAVRARLHGAAEAVGGRLDALEAERRDLLAAGPEDRGAGGRPGAGPALQSGDEGQGVP